MKPKCPHCGRTLLSRAGSRCKYCNKVLPPKFCPRKQTLHKVKCPQCGHVLISRLSDRCQYCKAELPPELRLRAGDKKRMREEMKARLEADRRASRAQANSGAGYLGETICWSSSDEGDDEANEERARNFLEAMPWTQHFIPQYNELSLYLMSLSFLLLCCLSDALREALRRDWALPKIHLDEDLFSMAAVLLIMGGMFLVGMILSLLTVFTSRIPSLIEKKLMLFFAVFVSVFSGAISGAYMLVSENLWMDNRWMIVLLVFPIWNILGGIYMLVLYRYQLIDETSISDLQVKPLQFLMATVILLATLFVCHFVLHLFGPITFSISVAYATMVGPQASQNHSSTEWHDPEYD